MMSDAAPECSLVERIPKPPKSGDLSTDFLKQQPHMAFCQLVKLLWAQPELRTPSRDFAATLFASELKKHDIICEDLFPNPVPAISKLPGEILITFLTLRSNLDRAGLGKIKAFGTNGLMEMYVFSINAQASCALPDECRKREVMVSVSTQRAHDCADRLRGVKMGSNMVGAEG